MVKKLLLVLMAVNAAGLIFAWANGFLGLPYAMAQKKSAGTEVSQEKLSIELIEEIKKRQEELDHRESELNSREDRIRSLEQDLDKKIAELKRLQMKLDELIKLRDDVEKKNVASLSKAYAAMPPEEAAGRMKIMDRAIALKILGGMKSKKAAQILTNLDVRTATEMTEQLAKRPLK